MKACSDIEHGENLLYMTDDMIIEFLKLLNSMRFKTTFLDFDRWQLSQELLEGSFSYKDVTKSLTHTTGHPRSLHSILISLHRKAIYFNHKTFGAFNGFN